MALGFLKAFLGEKGKDVARDFVDTLVKADPKAASAAQLQVMEQDLDKAGQVIQQLRVDLDRERKEAKAAHDKLARLMAAAEHLDQQQQAAQTAGDTARVASLDASLGRLLDELETFKPQAEQEQQDVRDVQSLLDEAEAAYREKAVALRSAKDELDRAARDMQRANLQVETAHRRAEQAARVAGLRGEGDSKLASAVGSMQRQASEARAKAESLKMKAQALSSTPASGGDPNIAAALEAAGKGSPALMGQSGSSRLAALRGTGAPKLIA